MANQSTVQTQKKGTKQTDAKPKSFFVFLSKGPSEQNAFSNKLVCLTPNTSRDYAGGGATSIPSAANGSMEPQMSASSCGHEIGTETDPSLFSSVKSHRDGP